jgi:hypothetical protein
MKRIIGRWKVITRLQSKDRMIHTLVLSSHVGIFISLSQVVALNRGKVIGRIRFLKLLKTFLLV